MTHFTRQPDAPFHPCNSYSPWDGYVGEQAPHLWDLWVPRYDSLVKGSTGFIIVFFFQVNLTVLTVIDLYFHKLQTFNRNLPWQCISNFNTRFKGLWISWGPGDKCCQICGSDPAEVLHFLRAPGCCWHCNRELREALAYSSPDRNFNLGNN